MSDAHPVMRQRVLQTLLAFVADVPVASRCAHMPKGAPADLLVAELVDEAAAGRVVVHTSGTRLERFLTAYAIKPAHLAQESGYSRQHLLRLRRGTVEPTRRCIAHLAAAASRCLDRPVTPTEMFDWTLADARVIARRRIARRTEDE